MWTSTTSSKDYEIKKMDIFEKYIMTWSLEFDKTILTQSASVLQDFRVVQSLWTWTSWHVNLTTPVFNSYQEYLSTHPSH